MPFLNSNCVSSCHLTNERQSAAIRLGNADPDNINVFYIINLQKKKKKKKKKNI